MNQEDLESIYHPQYHAVKNLGSLAAARSILPLVFELFEIESVLDVGCGDGTWLTVAGDLGASGLTGVEGEWALEWPKLSTLPTSGFELVTQDLEARLDLDRTFDLAMSLEVAEHLSPERAATFVDDLCSCSTRVLFGAAIPHQGGTNHLNEQWPSYWARLFEEHGYVATDFIRTQIWDSDDIPWWYRQNTVLFVHNADRQRIESKVGHSSFARAEALDVVHPVLYGRMVKRLSELDVPFLARMLRGIKRRLAAAMRIHRH